MDKYYKNDYENVILERTSVFYQYLLFKNAKLIIANHGASLSNIIFMNKNSSVIEIISKLKLYEQKEDLFINLGNSMTSLPNYGDSCSGKHAGLNFKLLAQPKTNGASEMTWFWISKGKLNYCQSKVCVSC